MDSNTEDICGQSIKRLARGDMDALSDIYQHMSRLIYTTAYAITENRQDAEDVLQDTLIEIVRYCKDYKKGSPKAWVITLTRHNAIDIIKKRKHEANLDDNDAAEEQSELEAFEIFDMLRPLEEKERQIVVYKLYTGLKFEEIAKVMHMTKSAVEKKYQRAIQKLREKEGIK